MVKLSSRSGVWLAGLVVLVTSAAACSSGGSSSSPAATGSTAASSGGVPAAVTMTLNKYLAEPVFTPPGPSVDVARLRGKKVFVIPIEETPFTQAVEAGERAAAKAAGVQLTFYPNEGEVSQWVQGMTTAIAQKPALIILDTAPDPRQLQPQIAAAKAAGIPVLVTHFYDASSPQPPACVGCAAGVTGIVKAPISTAGGAEADWIIANSGGKANVLIVSLNGLLPVPGMVAAADAQFKQYCPGCKVTTVAINLSQLATAGAFGQVSSALVQNPNITYVDPLFDASIPGTLAAITAAGEEHEDQDGELQRVLLCAEGRGLGHEPGRRRRRRAGRLGRVRQHGPGLPDAGRDDTGGRDHPDPDIRQHQHQPGRRRPQLQRRLRRRLRQRVPQALGPARIVVGNSHFSYRLGGRTCLAHSVSR